MSLPAAPLSDGWDRGGKELSVSTGNKGVEARCRLEVELAWHLAKLARAGGEGG